MSDPPNGDAIQAAATPPATAPASAESTNAPGQDQSRDQKETPTQSEETPKLSAAELKKRAKAEKQARRAQAKAAGPPVPSEKPQLTKDAKPPQPDQKPAKETKALPARRRPSQPHPPPAPKELLKKEPRKESKKEEKQTGLFFHHLYSQPRQHSVAGASKEVHPAVLALGLQYSSYVICGSTARMVAMLLAFKAAIECYSTPPGTSLPRHLNSHYLSPQIDYLRSCRPLSISMGNAIRWLKKLIADQDPSTPDIQAKRDLLDQIDTFIIHKATAAGEVIERFTVDKIQPNDVILTYASSSVVEGTFLRAHRRGIPFSVVVVDSKPLFEGRRLAQTLASNGIAVKYSLISGAAQAMKGVSKVFLGAHAMMSNGRLYSRVGTAIVSMLAHSRDIPVIVLCESIKFTDRVALDSIVNNEVAPADEVLSDAERVALLPLRGLLPSPTTPNTPKSATEPAKDDEEGRGEPTDVLKWFKETENLQMLQVLYDVTPAEYIKLVITEQGSLPPSSVPVVHRMSTNS